MPTPLLRADRVAFLKCAFLGLDSGEAAERYLGTTDARVAKRVHTEIRARAILRADRPDLAKHLLYVPPVRPPRPPRLRETFDEFVARRGTGPLNGPRDVRVKWLPPIAVNVAAAGGLESLIPVVKYAGDTQAE